MPDLVLATFQKASFRGVPFLFTDSNQSGGRKYKIFEYPNQDTRTTEDLGKLQRTYKMTATIADPTFTYINSRQKLVDALEQEGAGILVHPIEGVKRVFAEPYTLSDSISHTGTAVFNLTFVETGVELFPDQSPSNASNIAQLLDELIATINGNFASFWEVIASYEGNIEYSASLIKDMEDSFSNAGNLVTNEGTAYNSFIDNLTTLGTNAYSYTTEPTALVDNVQSLFSDAGQLGATTTDNLTIMASFFQFDAGDPIVQTTVPLEQREKNRIITNQLINTMGLSYYYLFVANTQFETEDEINDQHTILNDQFVFIITHNTYTDLLGSSFPILDDDTLSTLEDLRFNAHQSLNAQVSTARKIVDIYVKSDSLLPLTFAYYGDLDLYDDLYHLNDLNSAANIVGDFKVLTDEN